MKVLTNADLTADLCDSNSDGWEPSAASSAAVVFYTANYTAGYSTDGGNTFSRVSPYALAQSQGLSFCCDQVVQYIPQIDRFAWILQTKPDGNNENSYLLAVASPQSIINNPDKAWKVYNLSAAGFWKYPGHWLDYPELAVGNSYLYLECNFGDRVSGLIARFPLSDLANDTIANAQVAETNVVFCRPVQNTGDVGYFAACSTQSQLRIFAWGEGANDKPVAFDVDISTIPTENTQSISPFGTDWLDGGSKVRWASLYGATRSGNELWLSWNGGRRVTGQSNDTFKQPHIGIAVVDTTNFHLLAESYIWNPDYACAYPALATNSNGEVGISFAVGGGTQYVQHAVGFVSGTQELVTTTSGKTVGGGGHYVSIRRAHPDGTLFSAAGYNAPSDTTVNPPWLNRPHYVLFGRNPCQLLIDRVAVLENEVRNFQEALDNGEIPPPPRTPQKIAQFEARLRQLKSELGGAKAALTQCQAQNP
jgi:hypothetical protein